MKDDMYDNSKRAKAFKRSSNLEEVLFELNGLIEPLAQEKLSLPEHPIVLIMGVARSGSTLLMQYLANCGLFSYPSNLIARFFKNPYLGIRIQQALIEYDVNNELGLSNSHHIIDFRSNLGKTKGALSPSEFWYFWRDYFKFDSNGKLTEAALSKVDHERFLKNLSAFYLLFGKPLVMKGMMLNWNIPYLYDINNKFIFVNIKRDILNNAHSLYEARIKYFNDPSRWYSFKPEEYEKLLGLTPVEQVVGQVLYTQRAVELGLSQVPETNKIEITYEEFCNNPYSILEMLKSRFNDLGSNLILPQNNHIAFKSSVSEGLEDYKYALTKLNKL